GRIYVGGYSEFGYFESDANGKLTYRSLSGLIPDPTSSISDFIWKIHLYNDEVIFQSFRRAYIFKNGKITLLDTPNRFQFSFTVNNRLYFQDIANGVFEYKRGALFPLKGTSVLNNMEIWAMFSMPGKGLLIATLNNGLFLYENERAIPWKTEANAFIKKNNSLGGAAINDSLIVLNSVLDGIIICNRKGEIIQHVNIKRGLQNNTVLSSFVDSRGNLWLGLDNGISYINENSSFTYFGSSYNLGTVYASVIHNGILYAATNQGVFYHKMTGLFYEDTFNLVQGATAQSWNIQVIGNELIC